MKTEEKVILCINFQDIKKLPVNLINNLETQSDENLLNSNKFDSKFLLKNEGLSIFCKIIFKQLQYCKNNFTNISFEKLKKTVIQNIEGLNFKIDYFEFIELKTFTIQNKKIEGQQYAACIAVIVSGVRLIDNIIL